MSVTAEVDEENVMMEKENNMREKIDEFLSGNDGKTDQLFFWLDKLGGKELKQALSMLSQELQDKYLKG